MPSIAQSCFKFFRSRLSCSFCHSKTNKNNKNKRTQTRSQKVCSVQRPKKKFLFAANKRAMYVTFTTNLQTARLIGLCIKKLKTEEPFYMMYFEFSPFFFLFSVLVQLLPLSFGLRGGSKDFSQYLPKLFAIRY